MKRFQQLPFSTGSTKTSSSSSSSSSSSRQSSGAFSNLKLTAEKVVVVKGQASMQTHVQMPNSKLENSVESVHSLEDKLQNACNEIANLMASKQEDEKLWRRFESEFSSTKIRCDQLTETVQQLASHAEDAEKHKSIFESKINKSSEAIDFLNQQVQDLSKRLISAEEHIKIRDKELEEYKGQRLIQDEGDHLVYIDTNFGTRVAMVVHASDSIFDLKEKLCLAHERRYLEHGSVKVSGLKVKRGHCLFNLTDSMLMFRIFYHEKNNWFMSADFIKETKDCPILEEALKAKVEEKKTKKRKLKHSDSKKSRKKKKSSKNGNLQADATYGTAKVNEKDQKNSNIAGSVEDVPKAGDTIQPTNMVLEEVDSERRRQIREGKRIVNESACGTDYVPRRSPQTD